MSMYGWLAVYCSLVLLASLFGGYLPFLGRVTHTRLQLYLSAAAGVMLGAAFFHIMPHAMELAGPWFGWWMSVGVVGIFCIERFIAPHSHEMDGGKHHHHPGEAHHHNHGTNEAAHEQPTGKEPRAAAPAVAGWMAVLGLTIHTFMNGVGLAGAVEVDTGHVDSAAGAAAVALPGVAMFLAIVLHKPADALAISMVLSRKGVRPRVLALVQLGFAVMVPIGAALFCLTEGALSEEDLGSRHLTGAALSISAGTFLFIALSDLLPEVQFHRHDRIPLFSTLILGVALMGGIALLEGHHHGSHEAGHPAKTDGHHDDGDEDDDADHHHGGHGHSHSH